MIIIYLAFISLGLPDGILGSAWPIMHVDLGVYVDNAGYLGMLIALGTIISSINTEKLRKRLGTGKIVFLSTALTAAILFAYSFSNAYWMLVLLSVPYGLGAGSIDAALNSYVALHYESRHMSWLHCFWGVGASIGPFIMGQVFAAGGTWNAGYRIIGGIQSVLVLVLFLSLPLWAKVLSAEGVELPATEPPITTDSNPVSQNPTLIEIVGMSGVKYSLLSFFAYIGVETTTMVWFSSYLVYARGVRPELAATFASMFFLGITLGRGANGFLTYRFSDKTLIRVGFAIIGTGILLQFIPWGNILAIVGVGLIGLGCAPIYPCIIHQTPEVFGKDLVHAVVGVQMAAAYAGNLIFSPLFGQISKYNSISYYPVYVGLILLVMVFAYERMLQIKEL